MGGVLGGLLLGAVAGLVAREFQPWVDEQRWRARHTRIELGRQTGREAEVLSGLPEGARVIVHPGDLVEDGVRIKMAP